MGKIQMDIIPSKPHQSNKKINLVGGSEDNALPILCSMDESSNHIIRGRIRSQRLWAPHCLRQYPYQSTPYHVSFLLSFFALFLFFVNGNVLDAAFEIRSGVLRMLSKST